MLDHHPIARNGLYGAAAFVFVFIAAMSGTAFMITGGFGGSDNSAPADPPAYSAPAQQSALEPAVYGFAPNATTPLSSYASDDEGVTETANYEPEGGTLLGETSGAVREVPQAPPAPTRETEAATQARDDAWRALDRYQADVAQALNANDAAYSAYINPVPIEATSAKKP